MMIFRCTLISVFSLSCCLWAAAAHGPDVPLEFGAGAHDAEVTRAENGVWTIRTTGGDPYVVCKRVEKAFDHSRFHVLAFEYRCSRNLAYFEVFWGNPFNPRDHVQIKVAGTAPTWRRFAVDLAETAAPGHWNDKVRDFRVDFGNAAGCVVEVRNLRLRPPTAAEEAARRQRRIASARRLKTLQDDVNAHCIAPARIPNRGENTLCATYTLGADGGFTAVAVLGRDLDLAWQLREFSPRVPPPVPLPPPMVVGEGENPENHTLVRILNRYGVCELQFLAFPSSVRGGVDVQTGVDADGKAFIAAVPLADTQVREVRIFGRWGILRHAFTAPKELTPPFALVVGDFFADHTGDEIVLASAHSRRNVQPCLTVCALRGTVLRRLPLKKAVSATVQKKAGARLNLSVLPANRGAKNRAKPGGDRVIIHWSGAPGFAVLDPATGRVENFDPGLPGNCTGVFAGAFPDTPFVAAGNEPMFSHIWRIPAKGRATAVDVGRRENLFWFTNTGAFADVPEGRYVRHARFAHIRTDFGNPHATDPDFSRTDAAYWAGPDWRKRVANTLDRLAGGPPVCYEPCFTHRWFYRLAQKWAAVRDAETGLPKYVLLTRENRIGAYGEFGRTRSFLSGSYAPGLKAVRALYVLPQRAFLQALAPRLRRRPEHGVAVEPNHEMEINAESRTSHGDYNPAMIRAFYRYLIGLYGSLDGVNACFHAPFTDAMFDAPRGLERGAWDAYDGKNPFYRAWMRFLDTVIYRVVAGTYREALLAGFPPEFIKCHQIPDLYAVGSLTAFSEPARRITPIDWNLNAGVGFGFTRYGVWFNRRYNCVRGAESSGFDAVVIGEYQSLTPDADLAFKQLEYLHDHGVQFIHCMNWPRSADHGYNAALAEALRRLVKADRPRPGQTGGVGQVRSTRIGEHAAEIVSIGAGAERTGLLKSVGPDGRWDGVVYVVPFHAHVQVTALRTPQTDVIAAEPWEFGPFAAVDAGDVFEFTGSARAANAAAGALLFRVLHHGIEIKSLRLRVPLGRTWRRWRVLLRVQISLEDVRIEIASADGRKVAIRDGMASREREQTARIKRGIFLGKRHRGGVRFALLKSP